MSTLENLESPLVEQTEERKKIVIYQEILQVEGEIDDRIYNWKPLALYFFTLSSCLFAMGYDSEMSFGAGLYYTFTDIDINVNPQWLTWSTFIGVLVGCPLFGFLADAFGRRIMIITNTLIYAAATIFAINSWKWWLFFVGRFFCGVAIGGWMTVAPLLMAELAPQNIRGCLVAGLISNFGFGSFVCLLVLMDWNSTWN